MPYRHLSDAELADAIRDTRAELAANSLAILRRANALEDVAGAYGWHLAGEVIIQLDAARHLGRSSLAAINRRPADDAAGAAAPRPRRRGFRVARAASGFQP